MKDTELTPQQQSLVTTPIGQPISVFLEGPAGCGKTTVAVRRMLHLLEAGVRADRILVWVPQRSLARPFIEALRRPTVPAGARVDVLSLDGLARRTVDLFWPLVAEEAGFADPTRRPVFLTLETAQYYMNRVLEPLVTEGAFGGVTVHRNRLVSQIIDNLNKAALVGFPHTDIGSRLIAAWSGPSSRENVYQAVQRAASAFREFCLQHNLLDFSLQVTVFMRHVWPQAWCRTYLLRRYHHLIADNLEEDIPVAHDLLRLWLQHAASALLVYDQDGGFRSYLGADPLGAHALADSCAQRLALDESFVCSPEMEALGNALRRQVGEKVPWQSIASGITDDTLEQTLEHIEVRFHPELVRGVADEVRRLVVDEQIPPGEIAVLAPFVGDALLFALMTDLERQRVPVRSHRPSRALRDVPAVRCLLTMAQLAHSQWNMCPPQQDVAQALLQAIDGFDWVRAAYLTSIVYRIRDGRPGLASFAQLRPNVQERITFGFGRRYDALLRWVEAYGSQPAVPLDHFVGALFDELLSRPGYGFHRRLHAAAAATDLMESVRKFRWALDVTSVDELGVRYVRMVNSGVLAAQYVRQQQIAARDAVLIAPAYTFLTENRPVDYQFWLNINSPAWGRRLYQPLTHPFVLTRQWLPERKWCEEDEFQTGRSMLLRVVLGLLRRCRKQIYLCTSELNPRGSEERGPLQQWAQQLLREAHRAPENGRV